MTTDVITLNAEQTRLIVDALLCKLDRMPVKAGAGTEKTAKIRRELTQLRDDIRQMYLDHDGVLEVVPFVRDEGCGCCRLGEYGGDPTLNELCMNCLHLLGAHGKDES